MLAACGGDLCAVCVQAAVGQQLLKLGLIYWALGNPAGLNIEKLWLRLLQGMDGGSGRNGVTHFHGGVCGLCHGLETLLQHTSGLYRASGQCA